jgi:hypothetical protein
VPIRYPVGGQYCRLTVRANPHSDKPPPMHRRKRAVAKQTLHAPSMRFGRQHAAQFFSGLLRSAFVVDMHIAVTSHRWLNQFL